MSHCAWCDVHCRRYIYRIHITFHRNNVECEYRHQAEADSNKVETTPTEISDDKLISQGLDTYSKLGRIPNDFLPLKGDRDKNEMEIIQICLGIDDIVY